MSEPKTPDEFKGAYFQLRKCASDLSAGCARLQTERDELRAALKERDAEIEQLHVQLAGCGVAAMQNTESSKAERAKREDYGWSNSYDDVCRMVDREIAQRAVMQQALEAAEKFRAKCHDGRARSVETYDDMTQLVTALKEALK